MKKEEYLLMNDVIRSLALIIEINDPSAAGHQIRVAELACLIAKKLNLKEEIIESIKISGILHDIGKIFIPIQLLNKPGRLLEEEFNLIKIHPKIGYNIMKSINFSLPIADIILQQNEKYNGSGYPRGIKGKEILIQARIICVANVIEAIVSHRPYRPAIGIEFALIEISKNSGKLYDPDVVNACIRVFKEDNYSFKDV